MYYTGSFTSTSDVKLKNNIKPISDALQKVIALEGVTYEWKSKGEIDGIINKKTSGKENEFEDVTTLNLPEGLQYGVIAQEVEKVIPELVLTDPDGLKSVDYVKIIPVLIEAIKEQQKQIELLKGEVELLKTKK